MRVSMFKHHVLEPMEGCHILDTYAQLKYSPKEFQALLEKYPQVVQIVSAPRPFPARGEYAMAKPAALAPTAHTYELRARKPVSYTEAADEPTAKAADEPTAKAADAADEDVWSPPPKAKPRKQAADAPKPKARMRKASRHVQK